jgi:adenylylsulfate kinase
VAPGLTLWLTGLSGAGKSTLGRLVGDELLRRGHQVEVLDADRLRQSLSPELGFSKADRDRNVARIGFVAQLLSRNGVVAVVAAIAPYQVTRETVRRQHEAPFVEVYVSCPLDVLVQRDPKGLYARALKGEIQDFTGISAPYEPPPSPDIVVDTGHQSVEESVAAILEALDRRTLIRPRPTSPEDAERRS